MHPTVVCWALLPLVQSSAVALFACCGQCLVPVLLVSQSGATVSLSLVRPGVCPRCSSTKLKDAFPVLSPEKLLLVGGDCSQTQLSASSPLLGLSAWRVWLSCPHPRAGVTLSGGGSSWGCLYTARLVPFFFSMFIYFEGDTEHREGLTERVREIPSRLHTVSAEPDAGA